MDEAGLVTVMKKVAVDSEVVACAARLRQVFDQDRSRLSWQRPPGARSLESASALSSLDASKEFPERSTLKFATGGFLDFYELFKFAPPSRCQA